MDDNNDILEMNFGMNMKELEDFSKELLEKYCTGIYKWLLQLYDVETANILFNDFFSLFIVGYMIGKKHGSEDKNVDRLLTTFFRNNKNSFSWEE